MILSVLLLSSIGASAGDVPVLKLLGPNPDQYIIPNNDEPVSPNGPDNVDLSYRDLGAECHDSVEGDITDSSVYVSLANLNVPGTHIITYTCSNTKGVNAMPAERTVVAKFGKAGAPKKHTAAPLCVLEIEMTCGKIDERKGDKCLHCVTNHLRLIDSGIVKAPMCTTADLNSFCDGDDIAQIQSNAKQADPSESCQREIEETCGKVDRQRGPSCEKCIIKHLASIQTGLVKNRRCSHDEIDHYCYNYGDNPVRVLDDDQLKPLLPGLKEATAKEAAVKKAPPVQAAPAAPVVKVLGSNPWYRKKQAGNKNGFEDPGATCWDSQDGNLDNDVMVDFGHVLLDKPGKYKMTYQCVNSLGVIGHAVRHVIVVDEGHEHENEKSAPTSASKTSDDNADSNAAASSAAAHAEDASFADFSANFRSCTRLFLDVCGTASVADGGTSCMACVTNIPPFMKQIPKVHACAVADEEAFCKVGNTLPLRCADRLQQVCGTFAPGTGKCFECTQKLTAQWAAQNHCSRLHVQQFCVPVHQPEAFGLALHPERTLHWADAQRCLRVLLHTCNNGLQENWTPDSCKKCIGRIPESMKREGCSNVQSIWIKNEVCSGRNLSPKCTAVAMDRDCGDFQPAKKACTDCVNHFYKAAWIEKHKCDPNILSQYCTLHTGPTPQPTAAPIATPEPTPTPAVPAPTPASASVETKARASAAAHELTMEQAMRLPKLPHQCAIFLQRACGERSLLRLSANGKRSCFECATKAIPVTMALRYGCSAQSSKEYCLSQLPHAKDCQDFMDEDCGHLSPGSDYFDQDCKQCVAEKGDSWRKKKVCSKLHLLEYCAAPPVTLHNIAVANTGSFQVLWREAKTCGVFLDINCGDPGAGVGRANTCKACVAALSADLKDQFKCTTSFEEMYCNNELDIPATCAVSLDNYCADYSTADTSPGTEGCRQCVQSLKRSPPPRGVSPDWLKRHGCDDNAEQVYCELIRSERGAEDAKGVTGANGANGALSTAADVAAAAMSHLAAPAAPPRASECSVFLHDACFWEQQEGARACLACARALPASLLHSLRCTRAYVRAYCRAEVADPVLTMSPAQELLYLQKRMSSWRRQHESRKAGTAATIAALQRDGGGNGGAGMHASGKHLGSVADVQSAVAGHRMNTNMRVIHEQTAGGDGPEEDISILLVAFAGAVAVMTMGMAMRLSVVRTRLNSLLCFVPERICPSCYGMTSFRHNDIHYSF